MQNGKASIQPVPKVDDLIQAARTAFTKRFGREATCCGIAPGRVNLIGEHTDYNDGFVLPMALPLVTVIVGSAKGDADGSASIVTTLSQEVEPETEVTIDRTPIPGKPSWANYVKGVVANFPGSVPLFDAVVVTSVPIGGGVSSSASLEVATYVFLTALTNQAADKIDLRAAAKICQKAEHEFANMPCGIMDQMVSCLARKDTALLLDCRSHETGYVPLDDPDVVILITNSHVKHKLSGSEYPSRRRCCEEAAKHFGVPSLRHLKMEQLEAVETDLDPVMYRRARHVVSEISRTELAAEALKKRDYVEFGRLMYESHDSLRLDFEVSCPELDTLVDAVRNIEGVFGSRMTGGGFGGCTVTLVRKSHVETTIASMQASFEGSPSFYVCKPSDGCRAISF